MNKEHVIRGNSAVIKCLIPSFVADFVEVVSWHTDQDENYFPGTEYGAIQQQQQQVAPCTRLRFRLIVLLNAWNAKRTNDIPSQLNLNLFPILLLCTTIILSFVSSYSNQSFRSTMKRIYTRRLSYAAIRPF